jgi:6-hydroxycyclohex-1-ene-1-carbonyl-CoA dehydrogenase
LARPPSTIARVAMRGGASRMQRRNWSESAAMKIQGWTLRAPCAPMALESRDEAASPGEVVVAVAGCGVCHTDLGFFYDGVATRHPLPLVLGHEVSGRVVEAGAGAERWLGRDVIVPAVMPCGECDACRAGHGSVCAQQIFPGNDVHGGFATHLRVPSRGLCPVPDLLDERVNPLALDLPALSVIADAVSTPYQAVERSGLRAGDLAVFVGVGGVGGFGVQIAAARGAHVVAIDVEPSRLAVLAEHGASLTLRADKSDFRALKKEVAAFAARVRVPSWRTRIFETSGTVPGQETAFGLLGPGGSLSVVGYTPNKVTLRLSNLMALDAVAQGNWGCAPELYPAVLELVLRGQVHVLPFVERRPMSSINQTFADLHDHRLSRRVILVPET